MTADYDLTIVGSGFGGSLLAMIARRSGLSVLLLERGTHPRFAIGESTSPLTNLLIEQLANRYDLPRLLPLTTYGEWQHTYPKITCGLKRGFTFFPHTAHAAYQAHSDRSNQLAVAASPNDTLADTHWLRADVDTFLVREAVALGTDYRDHVLLLPPRWDGTATTLTGTAGGDAFTVTTRFLVDATGPHGFLSRALDLPELSFPDYPATQALYAHFTGVASCEMSERFRAPGTPPYPLDAAAVHHVFDGGWMWALRFDNGVTSAGVSVTDRFAREIALSDGEPAWGRILARFPAIGDVFASARAIRPFVHVPRLSYRASRAAGPGWALLPSAAAFIDPLFSTGFPLTLLGIERLGRIIEEAWGKDDFDDRLSAYGTTTLDEADATADFICGCLAALADFPVFADLSMFYFAAASYSEMARRLDKPHLTRGFLMAGHPEFGPAMRRATAQARARQGGSWDAATRKAFTGEVADGIACLNIAGLCDPTKRNWYPVDLGDVVAGAHKLEMTPESLRSLLAHAPWANAGTMR